MPITLVWFAVPFDVSHRKGHGTGMDDNDYWLVFSLLAVGLLIWMVLIWLVW